MPSFSVGKSHIELLNWLVQTWLREGPPACFIEGFSGVGKSSVARKVIEDSGWKSVMINMPEAGLDQIDNLFLDLATELSFNGIDDLANAVTEGKSFDLAIQAVLNRKILVVIDEFQRALDETGKPSGAIMRFMGRLANRPKIPGRMLLLTNRIVDHSKWSEVYTVHKLSGLSPDDAEALLEQLLNDKKRSKDIPKERFRDVVNWLGCNPRAIHVLVASLERSSLKELIGISPEIWEARDREVSAELLHRLERELLERTIEILRPETATLLRRLSVHRKTVKREAIEMLLPKDAEFAAVRDDLINRFLMEQHAGWFSLNPVVREISLQKLKETVGEFKQAHARAADHYMRHFQAKGIVGGGKLGGYFVEARYHLVQSERQEELIKIAGRFENHLKASFSSASPIPRQLDELNERIATLSALLETPGSKGLEYYLARLYDTRGAAGDLQKALHYAQRATDSRAPAGSWVLRLRLEAKINGPEKILRVAREGIAKVSVGSVFALYQSAGELLAQAGKTNEAIALLKEGITKIPADKGLVDLYIITAQLLAQVGKHEEATELLKEGIAKVPADKGAVDLYVIAETLLTRAGKSEGAIEILREGIKRLPVDSLHKLYPKAGELLVQAGKPDEAVTLLKDGIARIPVDKDVRVLYQSAGELLAQAGKPDEAVVLLKEGIGRIPSGKWARYVLIEAVLRMLLARQNAQALDEFLSGTGVLAIDPPQMALGKVLRFVMGRDWELAAKAAHEEWMNFPYYPILTKYEIFCWFCANDLSATQEALKRLPIPTQSYDPLNWLKAWIALKIGDVTVAQENLSAYLNRPATEQELNARFLLLLWDTPPTDFSRNDLAYFYPILPASLTGLPNDVVRMQYGPSVIFNAPPLREHKDTQLVSPTLTPSVNHKPNPSGVSQTQTWPIWIDETITSSGSKPRLDVGIVIALEEEFQELAPQIKMKPYYNPDIKQYYYLFERQMANAAFAPYRCVVTFMGRMGPTDAGVVGDRLMEQFHPTTVVSIGIAGSMDTYVCVGDVVVAEQTDEYLASSKAIDTSDKQDWDIQFSGDPYKSEPAYVEHALNLKYAHVEAAQNWESACKRKLVEFAGTFASAELTRQNLVRETAKIHTGHIASGPIVGATNKFVQWLKEKRDRKYLALEMESVGVLKAAHKRGASSLIIRGISDYSDERKHELDKIGGGALRKYAMNNALALLWTLMDLQLIKRAD